MAVNVEPRASSVNFDNVKTEFIINKRTDTNIDEIPRGSNARNKRGEEMDFIQNDAHIVNTFSRFLISGLLKKIHKISLVRKLTV